MLGRPQKKLRSIEKRRWIVHGEIRPIEESLKLFKDMRCGLIAEGKATLRMKQDMQNDNKNMADLIAYRIKVSDLT